MLEVVHPAPRVAEIRNPRNPEFLVQSLADEMHRVGRSRRNDHIDRMFRQILLEETDARLHPAHAWVRHEQAAADPQREALLEGFLAAGDFRDGAAGGSGSERLHVRRGALAHQSAVQVVRFGDGTADDFHGVGNLRLEGMVDGGVFRVFRRVDDGLPAFLRKIFGEFHPTLDARTPGRRPVICDDEHAFHRLQS